MLRVLLVHSAYGLRVAIREAEARLTFAGHEVRAPDLYGGRTAHTVADALALRDHLGRDTLLAEAAAFAEAWPPDAYGGFSLGASFAQHIALRRGVPARLVLFRGVGAAPSAPCPWLAAQAHAAHRAPV